MGHQTRIKRPRQLYLKERMRQNERFNEPPQFLFTRQKNSFSEEIINHLGHLNMDGKIDDKCYCIVYRNITCESTPEYDHSNKMYNIQNYFSFAKPDMVSIRSRDFHLYILTNYRKCANLLKRSRC